VKSVQLILNEWSERLDQSVSASAFCQARQKLRHTAFIELLEKAVIEVMYADSNYKKFKGHRLLALDGSTLHLPNTAETRSEFGIGQKAGSLTRQVEAKMTVLYDVLNRIPLSASLDKARAADIKASQKHLSVIRANDVVLADRAFGSYNFFAQILGKNANFVIRCKGKTYDKYHRLFSGKNGRLERTVILHAPRYLSAEGKIPLSLKVRFIKVELSNGEPEILATSLLDKRRYSRSLFKKLYYKRWNVETYFHILKSRLALDNFTGKSREAVYQDFYATIFVSGLESIITAEAEQELQAKKVVHPQKVNKAISFHAIKSRIVQMIFNQEPDIENKIKELFLKNPTLSRPDRKPPPRRFSIKCASAVRRSLFFQRYSRKHVF
jgi:hypothetical protein